MPWKLQEAVGLKAHGRKLLSPPRPECFAMPNLRCSIRQETTVGNRTEAFSERCEANSMSEHECNASDAVEDDSEQCIIEITHPTSNPDA